MKESLLTNSGTLHSQDRKSLPPLFTRYYRTELHALVTLDGSAGIRPAR